MSKHFAVNNTVCSPIFKLPKGKHKSSDVYILSKTTQCHIIEVKQEILDGISPGFRNSMKNYYGILSSKDTTSNCTPDPWLIKTDT